MFNITIKTQLESVDEAKQIQAVFIKVKVTLDAFIIAFRKRRDDAIERAKRLANESAKAVFNNFMGNASLTLVNEDIESSINGLFSTDKPHVSIKDIQELYGIETRSDATMGANAVLYY